MDRNAYIATKNGCVNAQSSSNINPKMLIIKAIEYTTRNTFLTSFSLIFVVCVMITATIERKIMPIDIVEASEHAVLSTVVSIHNMVNVVKAHAKGTLEQYMIVHKIFSSFIIKNLGNNRLCSVNLLCKIFFVNKKRRI